MAETVAAKLRAAVRSITDDLISDDDVRLSLMRHLDASKMTTQVNAIRKADKKLEQAQAIFDGLTSDQKEAARKFIENDLATQLEKQETREMLEVKKIEVTARMQELEVKKIEAKETQLREMREFEVRMRELEVKKFDAEVKKMQVAQSRGSQSKTRAQTYKEVVTARLLENVAIKVKLSWNRMWDPLLTKLDKLRDDAPEAAVQKAVNEFLLLNTGTLATSWTIQPKFSQDHITRVPDLACSKRDTVVQVFTCISAGDLKSKAVGVNNDTLGQLVDLCTMILKNQPLRCKVAVFAYSVSEAVQMVCERQKDGDYVFKQSQIFKDRSAFALLVHYLEATPKDLFFDPPVVRNQEFVPHTKLGEGASCSVFSAAMVGKPEKGSVVLKVYENEADRKGEESTLRKLAETGLKNSVPSVLGSDGIYLVVEPQAFHFGRACPFFLHHATELLGILRKAHTEAQLIHRDVRPANFFVKDDDGILLNDWADAVPVESMTSHAGTPELYTMPDLNDRPTASQDLYSFVLSCYALSSGVSSREAFPHPLDELPAMWQNLLDHAKRGDYGEVGNGLLGLLRQKGEAAEGKYMETCSETARQIKAGKRK